jgi:hypothetical protein
MKISSLDSKMKDFCLLLADLPVEPEDGEASAYL